jgi:hypothetical protein
LGGWRGRSSPSVVGTLWFLRKCVPESASQKVRSRSPVDPPPDSAAARAAGSRSVVAATA